MGERRALGVAHRGGAIAVDRTEIALAVDQRIAQVPFLGHPHQGVVNGLVAMRMIFFQRFADDAGAFGVWPGRQQTFAVHGVDNAPVNRLHAIAHVGQGALDDDAHRIFEKTGGHLFFDGLRSDLFTIQFLHGFVLFC